MKLRQSRIMPGVFGIIAGTVTMGSVYAIQPTTSLIAAFDYLKPTTIPTPTPSPIPTPIPSATPTPTQTPTPLPSPTPKYTPTPKPTIRIVSPQDLDRWFTEYSNAHSVDGTLLKKIAQCESHTNAQSTNGIYAGMFQFSPATWKNTRIRMNKDPDPALRFDPEAAIDTAAFTIATRGPLAWPNCH